MSVVPNVYIAIRVEVVFSRLRFHSFLTVSVAPNVYMAIGVEGGI